MKIIDSVKWNVVSSYSEDIVFNGNQPGDVVASELYVNPLSACTVVVKGYVNSSDTTGQTLKCFDVANMEKKASVTTAGNYMYMVGSYYKVNIAVTGTAYVMLKWLF